MSDLSKRISKLRESANATATHPKKDLKIPEYGERGEIKRKEIKIPKWLIWTAVAIAIIAATLYVPALPFVETMLNPAEPSNTLSVDAAMIRIARDYLQDNPSEDFDGDLLLNEQEVTRGTNPYKTDTDKDGISDYVELYTYDSNPLSYSNDLVSYVKSVTSEQGKNVGTPYKMNDVVMWPDDWNSRARGGVVKTINGYRFCNFKGWVQFPIDPVYAYQVVNGVHVLLPYREAEKAWRIVDETEVLLFSEEIEKEFEISVLGTKYYYELSGWQKWALKALEILLPSKSLLISAREGTIADRPAEIKPVLELKPLRPAAEIPVWRFNRNMNNLSDLAAVYRSLNEGKCLLVSFYVENEGEALAEVYGYDENGGLFLCDIDTLSPIDTLKIIEKTSKVMLAENEIFVNEWFSFAGCGIDSTKKNVQIRFFDWVWEEEPAEKEAETGTTDENITQGEQEEDTAEQDEASISSDPNEEQVDTEQAMNPEETSEKTEASGQ